MNNPKTKQRLWAIVSWVAAITGALIGREYPLPTLSIILLVLAILLGIKLNERRRLKSTGGEYKKTNKALVIYAVVMAPLAILLAYYLWQSSDSYVEEQVQEAVATVKASTSLPQHLDEVTDIIDITAHGKTIQYHEQIHDADTSTITSAQLRNLVLPRVCGNSSLRKLLDSGAEIEYLYTVKEDANQHFNVYITKKDCAN